MKRNNFENRVKRNYRLKKTKTHNQITWTWINSFHLQFSIYFFLSFFFLIYVLLACSKPYDFNLRMTLQGFYFLVINRRSVWCTIEKYSLPQRTNSCQLLSCMAHCLFQNLEDIKVRLVSWTWPCLTFSMTLTCLLVWSVFFLFYDLF
jgi:hypothetical protein